MGRVVTGIVATLAVSFAAQGDACAHALGQRYDLPLPLEYYLLASGTAVAVSFVFLAIFLRRPIGAHVRDFDQRPLASGAVPVAIIAAGRTFLVATLVLVVAAGFFGNQAPFKNIAPVTVWVIWWVGLSLFSAFVGNFWTMLNPWAAVFALAEKFAMRWGGRLSFALPYPPWLGAWPACAFFWLFAWFELVADGRDVPRNIAIATIIYSLLTWAGFVLFGHRAWLKYGEVFSIAFGLFGRFAPLHFAANARWTWKLRPYAAGLLTRKPLAPSMTAFTLLMLATVSADGLMETPLWRAIAERILSDSGDAAKPMKYQLIATGLLVAGPITLAALYVGVVGLMTLLAHGPKLAAAAGLFVLSLVPIAIAYHLAHYFSLLAVAGQFIIPLVSDPFGYGWDLFGTILYRIDISVVDARFIWYLAVIAIVSGHIIAVWLAHLTAFAVYADSATARRSQYPMLALMIGYTMLSLWILAEPIVAPAK
ncbi:MAG: hypothetical protein M3R18_00510 [Pseudomonadota bacterium]|nr:hypothetical protein [Pseudomonadota bacterium]